VYKRQRSRAAALLELTKPRITQLVLLTAAAGFYLGSHAGVRFALLGHTLVGVALVAAGTNALNQLREREVDARMRRTRGRPLPSGRLTPRGAAWFALLISLGGLAYLVVAVNGLTASLAAVTLTSYVLLYTPLKRKTALNTLVGAVPGALPIVGGWTAAGGTLDRAVLGLFAILFLSQLPHFLALAWIYREDYQRGELLMVSVTDPDGRRTGRLALTAAVTLLPVSLVPMLVGVTGWGYGAGALALGAGYAAAALALARAPSVARARALFLASIAYLPTLLALLVLGKTAA